MQLKWQSSGLQEVRDREGKYMTKLRPANIRVQDSPHARQQELY